MKERMKSIKDKSFINSNLQPFSIGDNVSTDGKLPNNNEIQQILSGTDTTGIHMLILLCNNKFANSNTLVGESNEDLHNTKNIADQNTSDDVDSIANNKKKEKPYFTATEIASGYGWSAQRLNSYLEFKQIQKRDGKKWKPLEKYISEGFVFQIHWFRCTSYRWTEKGKRFIEDQLKADGVVKVSDNSE